MGARDAEVTVDPTAIPWLRLAAASTSSGEEGGRLADATFIQRIATTGGRAPSPATCALATAGTREEIPYTAEYVFWKAKRA